MKHYLIIRYIVLVIAILLVGFGIYFVFDQVEGGGDFSFSLPIISSKFESSSAGLMMIFFGCVMLIYTYRQSKSLILEKNQSSLSSSLRKQRNVLIFFWTVTILTYLGGYLDKYFNKLESNSGFWGFTFLFGFGALIKTIDFIEDYLEGK